LSWRRSSKFSKSRKGILLKRFALTTATMMTTGTIFLESNPAAGMIPDFEFLLDEVGDMPRDCTLVDAKGVSEFPLVSVFARHCGPDGFDL